MKRIDLTKYGFYQVEDKDFKDDGFNYKGFGLENANRVKVSKLVSDDYLYLSGYILGNLHIEEYSKLSHYNDMDKLNGVELSEVTPKDIEDFYNSCIAYQKEYELEESKIVFPTREELVDKITKEKQLREKECQDVLTLLKDNVEKLLTCFSEYEFKLISGYYKSLKKMSEINVESRVSHALNNYESRVIMQDTQNLEESWYYLSLVEMINNKIKK